MGVRSIGMAVWLGAMVMLPLGCALAPASEDPVPAAGPVDPLESFEEVGDPQREYRGTGPTDTDNLSSDIERLQDARREYRNESERQSSERARRQAECRESAEGREVPIEDGSGEPLTFCER